MLKISVGIRHTQKSQVVSKQLHIGLNQKSLLNPGLTLVVDGTSMFRLATAHKVSLGMRLHRIEDTQHQWLFRSHLEAKRWRVGVRRLTLLPITRYGKRTEKSRNGIVGELDR